MEGLFGQVLPYVFEILPYLHARNIFPDWEIPSTLYGYPPHGLIIPGVVDLAYQATPGPKVEVNLLQLRIRHSQVLGNDWRRLSTIWNDYFCIPHRITESAATLGSLSDAVGVHYRGNDKLTASWDTNLVTHNDYLLIIRDFLATRPEFRRIFLATDDFRFYHFLKLNLSLDIINLGEVGFHKVEAGLEELAAKADRAMLDCVLLSRCGAVLLTSSALPSFTKILNPELEIYRVSASKLFAAIPYFPVAYIPCYNSSSPQISALVDRLMKNDWTREGDAQFYNVPFAAGPRYLLPSALRRVYNYVRGVEQWRGFGWIGRLRIHLRKWALERSR